MSKTPTQPRLVIEEEPDGRSYEATIYDWLDLAAFCTQFVLMGGNPSLYHSRDGNALCISLRSGKESRKYWIGPDDDFSDVLRKTARQWGIPMDGQNPIYQASEALTAETLKRLREAGLDTD